MGLKDVLETAKPSVSQRLESPRQAQRKSPSRRRQGTATLLRDVVNGEHVEEWEEGINSPQMRGDSRSAPGGGVSVTVLTLDGNFSLPAPGDHDSHQNRNLDHEEDLVELKLVKDFYTRRKYGRRYGLTDRSTENKTVLSLSLFGTKYFNSNDSPFEGVPGNKTASTMKAANKDSIGNASSHPGLKHSLLKTVDCGVSGESKVSSYLSTSLPGLTSLPRSGRIRSDDLLQLTRFAGSPSLLLGDFGFNTARTDHLSGYKRLTGSLEKEGVGDLQLLKVLQQHAQRQIVACQNTGYFHRGSRAAQNVLNLRQTFFPRADSYLTRFLPIEGKGGCRERMGTPPVVVLGEEERRRRLVHPGPGARLSAPKIPDRQQQASHRAALPAISGSSLTVMLAEGHGE